MKYKIVVDSSSDLSNDYLNNQEILFEVVPLYINVGNKEFVDDANLDIVNMLECMDKFSGKSTSACPGPGMFMKAFEGADNVFCVTISKKLSGSYNSALLASQQSDNPNIHVIDSKLVSGAMIVIVDELVRLINLGLEYKEIKNKIDLFASNRNLYFVLNKFDNLVKNGRMNRLTSIVATILFIKPLCAGIDGEIAMLEKPRTLKAAYKRIVENIKQKVSDLTNLVCVISYCLDADAAAEVKKLIAENLNFKEVRVVKMRGLCSFYALPKGIIVSF